MIHPSERHRRLSESAERTLAARPATTPYRAYRQALREHEPPTGDFAERCYWSEAHRAEALLWASARR